MNSNLGEIIKDRGFNISSFSRACGVSRPTLSGIVRGKNDGNVSTLIAIADYLDISLDVLVGREPYEQK